MLFVSLLSLSPAYVELLLEFDFSVNFKGPKIYNITEETQKGKRAIFLLHFVVVVVVVYYSFPFYGKCGKGT